MGIELQSETRIVIGRLCAPSDPERPWWWQSSTTIEGTDITVAGVARTESDAILEAAASTLQLRLATSPEPAIPRRTGADWE
jgi:hypothetical protein